VWFEFASAQSQGKRSAQEDAVEVALPGAPAERAPGCAERLVVAMADGMGGHVGGRIASAIVSKRFVEMIGGGESWGETAVAALAQANQALRAATQKRPELDGMGSTLVGASLGPEGLAWVSVGDTGLFLLRGDAYARLNEDHSFGAYLDDLAANGLITADAAAQDRRRNQLFHALLGDPVEHFECRGQHVDLQPGDVVLIATDGLKTLDDAAVGTFLSGHRDLPAVDLVGALIEAVEAADRPRQDNTTLFIVRARDGDMPDAPSISRMVGPLLRGVREPDTTLEIPRGGAAGEGDGSDAVTRVVAPPDAPPVRPEAKPGLSGPERLAPVGPPDEAVASPRGLALVAAVGVICAGLIGLLWYVLSR
jgi:serine/threonine protein phosphatase PrpC